MIEDTTTLREHDPNDTTSFVGHNDEALEDYEYIARNAHRLKFGKPKMKKPPTKKQLARRKRRRATASKSRKKNR